MKTEENHNKRPDFSRIIRRLMAERDIRGAKALAKEINKIAGKKFITPNSVSKWLRPVDKGGSEPKATSLMFLAKALKVSADLFLFDEGESSEKTKSLERIVSTIVKAELEKSGTLSKNELNKEFLKLLESDQIPEEEKEGILRQIRNLHKLYSKKSKDNDSDSTK